MKIGEAIQKCYENPGNIFESLKYLMMYDLDRELLVFAVKNNNPNWFISRPIEVESFESDWQPVLQEVTWQEALESWAQQDKTIKCILPTEKSESLCINKENIIDPTQSNVRFLSKLIEYGKWYILEE